MSDSVSLASLPGSQQCGYLMNVPGLHPLDWHHDVTAFEQYLHLAARMSVKQEAEQIPIAQNENDD